MIIYDIVASIVLYRNDPTLVGNTISSFLKTDLRVKLYLVDNSPTRQLSDLADMDPRIEYIFNDANLGFGKAHNIALRLSLPVAKYHLVLNPDVTFGQGTLEKVLAYMEGHPDTGLILPAVLSFEGERQYVCKRLPRPVDLIVRRFGSGLLSRVFKTELERYEMRDKDYNVELEAPSLSGCFMFLRTEALEKVGLFDERFFMYMEDIDLSRRVHASFRNVYYPEAVINHGHARESYKTVRLLKIHAVSAIRYFNKWGWLFDGERRRINRGV